MLGVKVLEQLEEKTIPSHLWGNHYDINFLQRVYKLCDLIFSSAQLKMLVKVIENNWKMDLI